MTSPTMVRTDDGCEIAAYDFGGSGDPLFFTHATGFHAHLWLPVIDRLRDTFHCYAMDERGHGASPTPANGDFRWRRMATDARGVADAFGLRRPKAVGHSSGGAQLLMAEQDEPGIWEAIWAYEPVIGEMAPEGENPLSAGAMRRRATFESRQAAYENFASKPPFDAFDPEALRLYVEWGFVDSADGGVTLACRREDEAATYRHALDPETFARLGEVTIPVHVVCGATSRQFPTSRLTAAVHRLPNASLDAMDDLGHFGPFESPERVASSIAAAFA